MKNSFYIRIPVVYFKQVYSDGSEKLFVEYSGFTVLEIVDKRIEGIVFCHWQDNIPKNWESEIQEIENKIKEFPWKKIDLLQRFKDRVYMISEEDLFLMKVNNNV